MNRNKLRFFPIVFEIGITVEGCVCMGKGITLYALSKHRRCILYGSKNILDRFYLYTLLIAIVKFFKVIHIR